MDQLVTLSVYGVSIDHPPDWQIYINPNNKFTFNEGLIKIDKVTEKKGKSTSLTVRWATMKQEIHLDDYVKELQEQFKKNERKSRHKDSYKIINKSKCLVHGKEAYLLQQEFVANHSIYRILGKEEMVKVLQILFFSKRTNRIFIASLLTTPEELKQNEKIFKEMLYSLHENIGDRFNVGLEKAKLVPIKEGV